MIVSVSVKVILASIVSTANPYLNIPSVMKYAIINASVICIICL